MTGRHRGPVVPPAPGAPRPAPTHDTRAQRLRGLRATASTLDHGTLCQLGHLEDGNPDQLAGQYRDLKTAFPHMNVFGGCCGTDYVHVEKIAKAVLDA